MRFVQTVLATVTLCAALAAPTSAQDQSRIAAMDANIEQALRSEPYTTSFWKAIGNGWVREKRSGMLCAGELTPDMPLDFLSGPDASFSPVGCIYRSADKTSVVHVMVSPNPLGTEMMRRMQRMTVEYTDKEVIQLGGSPIPEVNEGEEEGLTSVSEGKKKIHYFASGTEGKWYVSVHTIAPRSDAVDTRAVREVPVRLLVAALASIKSGRH